MKPRSHRSRSALTLVEVLASLVLLGMLTAAAASLTGHAASVASARLDSANATASLDALTRLILADVELVRSATRSTHHDPSAGSFQPIQCEFGRLILSVRAADKAEHFTQIVYAYDPSTSTISRSDGFTSEPRSRMLLGGVDGFDVSMDDSGPESGGGEAILSIFIRSRYGSNHRIRLPIAMGKNTDG